MNPVKHARLLVFAALVFAALVTACAGGEPSAQLLKPEVRVTAATSLGERIEGVAVHLGSQVVITDADGEALFGDLEVRADLHIAATCPRGYSGEPLERRVPAGVAQSVNQWQFRLSCEPDFIEVSLAVSVSECDRATVLVDGVNVGSTDEGMFHLVQRRSAAGTLEVQVEPDQTGAECRIPLGKRAFSFDRGSPGIWARFDGELAKKRQRLPRRREAPALRPYRL